VSVLIRKSNRWNEKRCLGGRRRIVSVLIRKSNCWNEKRCLILEGGKAGSEFSITENCRGYY
jgi:hypothetical protein